MTTTHRLLWLRCAAALTVATGLVAALAAHPAAGEPWRLLFDLLSLPVDVSPGPFSAATRQSSAVLGGVMVGWGATLFALAGPTFSHARGPVARAVSVGLVLWFVVDSVASVVSGLPGNVALNGLFGFAFAMPLVRLAGGEES